MKCYEEACLCGAGWDRDRRKEREDISDFITLQRLSSETFLRSEPNSGLHRTMIQKRGYV